MKTFFLLWNEVELPVSSTTEYDHILSFVDYASNIRCDSKNEVTQHLSRDAFFLLK